MVEINVTPEVREINIEVSRALKGDTGATGATGATGPAGADGADGVVQTVVGGTNITVDATDPANPIVNNTQDISGKADKTNVLELDNTDAFTPTLDYHPSTKKYVDDNAGGGGGGEFQYYDRIGNVDSLSTSNWASLNTFLSASTNEWNADTLIAKTASMTTIGAAFMDGISPIGVAKANQTVERFQLWTGLLQGQWQYVSIVKVGWSTSHTVMDYITVLYESSISIGTDGLLDIPAASFSTTSISKDDWIYVFFGMSTTSNRDFVMKLSCTID